MGAHDLVWGNVSKNKRDLDGCPPGGYALLIVGRFVILYLWLINCYPPFRAALCLYSPKV